jgi:hypothetical protein
MDCETCLVRGDHGSKYRVDVNAPGCQAILGFRSADIIVESPISLDDFLLCQVLLVACHECDLTPATLSGRTRQGGQDLTEQ